MGILFKVDKIINSIKAAYESVGDTFNEADRIYFLNHFNSPNYQDWCIKELGILIPSVENIQDKVEKLMLK